MLEVLKMVVEEEHKMGKLSALVTQIEIITFIDSNKLIRYFLSKKIFLAFF